MCIINCIVGVGYNSGGSRESILYIYTVTQDVGRDELLYMLESDSNAKCAIDSLNICSVILSAAILLTM